ncbi:MAG: tetratricopeptide repeat protein [Anaerolinea sp.]|nr:tetratricopeptide repeat protein [Anaerolinea sp.]
MASPIGTTTRIGKRYALHSLIGSGGMGSVYRATDLLTGQTVALKRVLVGNSQGEATGSSSSAPRLALAHEFQLLATLRHPNIISVLDYGFDEERQPYFTMDLLPQAQTILQAGRERPFPNQIHLLLQILEALLYLHRRHILHRDLKPANVLVANDQVKVLDFGLSSSEEEPDSSGTAGTWAYMAPELLAGQAASPASDLYAFGIIAYEMLAAQRPFPTLYDTLVNALDLSPLPDHTPLRRMFSRLLARQPDQRYQNTRDVIHDLGETTGFPLLPETAAIRDSFLQAAQFVGRTNELAQLSGLMKQALAGRGSAWLIGGESGVGKSRLLDELQPRALVQGALVLRGQSVREGSAPFQLWLPTIRWLALITDIDDLEASLLTTILPDIGELLHRPIADPPEADTHTGRALLLNTISNLFYRQTQPIVLLLEDLHWARPESLALLGWLTQMNQTLPLFIVATYRDDETPHLPAELRYMQLLQLKRLDNKEIAALSEAMLGQAGRSSTLVAYLQRETEGNAFFLVEVARALAEEAGRLAEINQIDLPAHILPGGMRGLIQRRLERVPETERPLLRQAAVLGRQLDLKLLATIAPHVALDRWLVMGQETAVFDIQEGAWRFAHDKLRDALLLDLTAVEQRTLHQQAATAIETVYPHLPQYTNALAYHWQMAGNPAKEAYYTLAAGTHALESCAYQVAAQYFERALQLQQPSVDLAAVEQRLGQAYHGLGRYDQAQTHLITAVKHCQANNDNQGMAYCLYLLSQTAYAIGAYAEAEEMGQRSLRLAQTQANSLGVARAHYSLGNAAYMVGQYSAAREHYENSLTYAQADSNQWEVVEALNGLGNVAYELGDYDEAERRYQDCLTLATTIGNRDGIAKSYNNLGLIAERREDYAAAWEYHQRSLALKREFGQKRGISISLMNLGVIAFAQGKFEEADLLLHESLGICQEIGDTWGVACCLSNLGDVNRALGSYKVAYAQLQEAWLTSLSIQAVPLALSVLLSMGELYAGADDWERALALALFVVAQDVADGYSRLRAEQIEQQARQKLAVDVVTAVAAHTRQYSINTIATLFDKEPDSTLSNSDRFFASPT